MMLMGAPQTFKRSYIWGMGATSIKGMRNQWRDKERGGWVVEGRSGYVGV